MCGHVSDENLGRKRHPVLVHRLLANGPLRFSELSDAVEPITNSVLSHSLVDFRRRDLVERTLVDDQPAEVECALTERGAVARISIGSMGSGDGPTSGRPGPRNRSRVRVVPARDGDEAPDGDGVRSL